MKRTGIVKKTLILLLGLVVYFSVASPVETYAAELISGSYTVSVPENVIAGVNDPSKVVTLSGTWAANQNVTVTADESITMTCGSATVSTTVNFDSVTKTGSA